MAEIGTAIRTEQVHHQTQGVLEKKYEYTYDKEKYSSLEVCIEDHLKMEEEKSAAEQAYREEVEVLKQAYEQKYKEWKDSEPQLVIPPFNYEQFEGRGYINKETYVPKENPLLKALADATPEEIEQLKQLLK